MKHYFKCIDGCKRCTNRGIFVYDKAKVTEWKCRSNDTSCNSTLEEVSWWLARKDLLIRFGIFVAILLISLVGISKCQKSSALSKRVKTIEADTTSWKRKVSKVPQNRDRVNPYQEIWGAKWNDRLSKLKDIPSPDIGRDLEKLREQQDSLVKQQSEYAGISVPTFSAVKTPKIYSEARKIGSEISSSLSQIKGELALLERKDFDARLLKLTKEHKQISAALSRKTKRKSLTHTTGDQSNPQLIVKNLNMELKTAQVRILAAIKLEKQRRAEEELARERRRREALAEAQRRSEAEKEKIWNQATSVIRIKSAGDAHQRLIVALIEGHVKNVSGDYPKLLKRQGKTKYLIDSHSAIELEEPGNEARTAEQIQFYTGDLIQNSNVHKVIAMDAMVLVKPTQRTISSIKLVDVDRLAAGMISSWSELGQESGSLQVYANKNSLNADIISSDIKNLITRASNVQQESDFTKVLTKSSALGFTSFHASTPGARLGLQDEAGNIVKPTPTNISNENYRYSLRLYSEISSLANDSVEKFNSFIMSDKGQELVAGAGYVNLQIQLVSEPVSEELLPVIAKALNVDNVTSAYRLNTNLRFASSSSNLDKKAEYDVDRISKILNIHARNGAMAVVVGFTDSTGDEGYNLNLSKERSRVVAGKIKSTKLLKSVGLGEEFPVADNLSEAGKMKNRRVEVWIVKVK